MDTYRTMEPLPASHHVRIAEWGGSVIALATCVPGHGSALFGLGDNKDEAIRRLDVTPLQGHTDPETILSWAHVEPSQVGAFLAVDRCTCECACGCSETATHTEQDIPLCGSCSRLLYTQEGEFLGCGQTDLGEVCSECGESIEWGCLQSPGDGQTDCKVGSCGCGQQAWRDEDHEGWGHYSYRPNAQDGKEIVS